MLVQAFALNVARCLSAAWTWFFTLALPRELRDSHRAEVHSDVHEQISQFREEGHSPCGIAAHLIFRMVIGLKDDFALALPYAPQAIAEHLDRGSTALSQGKPNSTVIATLAILLILNLSYWTSEDEASWVSWGFLNLGILVIGKLSSKPLAPWVQRALQVLAYITIVAALGALAWFVVQNRLYEAPHFSAFAAAFGISTVALWGAVHAGKKLPRGLPVGERCRTIVAFAGIIVVGSIVTTIWIPSAGAYLALLWLFLGMAFGLMGVTLVAALVFAMLLWHGGTWTASKGMQAIADTIRR